MEILYFIFDLSYVFIAILHRSHHELRGLCILHPSSLSVYAIQGEQQDQNVNPEFTMNIQNVSAISHSLEKVYTHPFGAHFSAYGMVYGPFGKRNVDHDLILVQSMDGRIQVFDLERRSFSRKISSLLLPSPMAYLPSIDAFVISNTLMEIECYKYTKMLSVRSSTAPNANLASAGKKILSFYFKFEHQTIEESSEPNLNLEEDDSAQNDQLQSGGIESKSNDSLLISEKKREEGEEEYPRIRAHHKEWSCEIGENVLNFNCGNLVHSAPNGSTPRVQLIVGFNFMMQILI